jgi:oligoribonuclease
MSATGRSDTTPPNLVWVDLEMTGLDPESCTILEIATLVTDSDLRVVAEGPCLVVHASDEALARMDATVREMHGKSGLTERVRASNVTLADAESQTLTFLAQHVAAKQGVLCGNSVWKDRAFLERYMPRVIDFLHYRMIDVSTIKELVRRWYSPELLPKKREAHRARGDILESIDELRHYRERVFIARGA